MQQASPAGQSRLFCHELKSLPQTPDASAVASFWLEVCSGPFWNPPASSACALTPIPLPELQFTANELNYYRTLLPIALVTSGED